MDPSLATQVLEFLTSTVMGAAAGLEEWSWVLFTALMFLSVVIEYGKSAAAGDPLGLTMFGHACIRGFLTAIVVGLYFSLAFPMMEQFREFGMTLSGAELDTVDIGEIARQADVVTERINTTIESLQELGWIDQIKALPEIAGLKILGFIVKLEYALLALIAIWVFAKFCLGFLTGGVFVGALAWQNSYEFGMRSITYLITSTQPLFLLAFMQGVSARLIQEAPVLTGTVPITTAEITDLFIILMFVFFLSLAAVSVPREWLSAVVGSGDAPSMEKATRKTAQIGGAGGGAMRSISNATNRIAGMLSGGGGKPSGGGGGSSTPFNYGSGGGGGANAGIPKLTFNPPTGK